MDFEGKYQVRIARDETTSMPKTERLWYNRHAKIALLVALLVVATTSLLLGYATVRHSFEQEKPQVAAEKIQPPALYLTVNAGTVEMLDTKTNVWERMQTGKSIIYGSIIKTEADGYATLLSFDNSAVRMGPNTEVEFSQIRNDDEHGIVLLFKLNRGQLWNYVVSHADHRFEYSIMTKNATATVNKDTGAVFAIETDGNVTSVAAVEQSVSARYLQAAPAGSDKEIQSASAKDIVVAAGTRIAADQNFTGNPAPVAQDAAFINSYWYKWNRELDVQYRASLENAIAKNGPALTVSMPSDGYHSRDEFVAVEGTTAIEATVYINDKQIENNAGHFTYRYHLGPGQQIIIVKAVDHLQNSTVKSLTVFWDQNAVTTDNSATPAAVGLAVSQKNNGLLVAWTAYAGTSFKEYRLVRSTTNANPSYPKDGSYQVVTNQGTLQYLDTNVAAGQSYNYRVCVVTQSSAISCSSVVNKDYAEAKPEEDNKPVVPDPVSGDPILTLQDPVASSGNFALQWSVYVGSDLAAYKVIASKDSGAALTADLAGAVRWTSSSAEETVVSTSSFIPALTAGTWNVRVAATRNGADPVYSNTVQITVGE